MRRKLLLMEMKLKLIKKQTNKPPTKVTPRANAQLNSCSRGERDTKNNLKNRRKVFKVRNPALYGWHIYTIMCRIQSSSVSSTVYVKFQVSSSLVFLFYFGVKVSKWGWEMELLVHVTLTKPTLHHIKDSTSDLVHFCEMGYFPLPPAPGRNSWSSWGCSMSSGLIWVVSVPVQREISLKPQNAEWTGTDSSKGFYLKRETKQIPFFRAPGRLRREAGLWGWRDACLATDLYRSGAGMASVAAI